MLSFFLMIRRPPRSTQSRSSAASDVYKRQIIWYLKLIQFSKIQWQNETANKFPEKKKVTQNHIFMHAIPMKWAFWWLTSRNISLQCCQHTLLRRRKNSHYCLLQTLSLIHIWRCRRSTLCRSRWSPYH